MKQKAPLKIPILKCSKCRYRRKPRLKYKEPFELLIYLPRFAFSVTKAKPIHQKEDGGFLCYCPTCGAKHDLILERERPKPVEVRI